MEMVEQIHCFQYGPFFLFHVIGKKVCHYQNEMKKKKKEKKSKCITRQFDSSKQLTDDIFVVLYW